MLNEGKNQVLVRLLEVLSTKPLLGALNFPSVIVEALGALLDSFIQVDVDIGLCHCMGGALAGLNRRNVSARPGRIDDQELERALFCSYFPFFLPLFVPFSCLGNLAISMLK